MLAQVAITALPLVIGLAGIAVLIGVGEALNNAIAAFAAVSLPFALLAGIFSWLVPRARWVVAVALAAPIVIICVMSARMGSLYVPGALWTMLCCLAGAYAGGQLKRSRSGAPPIPPA